MHNAFAGHEHDHCQNKQAPQKRDACPFRLEDKVDRFAHGKLKYEDHAGQDHEISKRQNASPRDDAAPYPGCKYVPPPCTHSHPSDPVVEGVGSRRSSCGA